jgi:hypothetical protein
MCLFEAPSSEKPIVQPSLPTVTRVPVAVRSARSTENGAELFLQRPGAPGVSERSIERQVPAESRQLMGPVWISTVSVPHGPW